MKGVIVMSVPKSGTNFMSKSLVTMTGWRPRWGRPTRDFRVLQSEIPAEPDEYVMQRAVHLIFTDKDVMDMPEGQRPDVFGGRKLVAVPASPSEIAARVAAEQAIKNEVIIAEHPVRSLPYFIRNPQQVSIIQPEEVVREAEQFEYGVIFLHRDFKDTLNSLAHFLHAGTRYVQFPSLEVSFDVVLNRYAPVLARAIRTWQKKFEGMIVTYERLSAHTEEVLGEIRERFNLPLRPANPLATPATRAFTFRKGGSGDWRNHMSSDTVAEIDRLYGDLIVPPC